MSKVLAFALLASCLGCAWLYNQRTEIKAELQQAQTNLTIAEQAVASLNSAVVAFEKENKLSDKLNNQINEAQRVIGALELNAAVQIQDVPNENPNLDIDADLPAALVEPLLVLWQGQDSDRVPASANQTDPASSGTGGRSNTRSAGE